MRRTIVKLKRTRKRFFEYPAKGTLSLTAEQQQELAHLRIELIRRDLRPRHLAQLASVSGKQLRNLMCGSERSARIRLKINAALRQEIFAVAPELKAKHADVWRHQSPRSKTSSRTQHD